MKVSILEAVKSPLLPTNLGKKFLFYRRLWFYLEKIGYFKSLEAGLPLDREGNCLPWYTYPMISFLKDKIQPDMTVFEYGSGNSTLWWSKQVCSITAVEHDLDWYNSLKEKIASNVKYLYCELDRGGRYCQTVLKGDRKFDIIVIDGRDRVNCARNALEALKSDGVIIWDNSEREQYREGYAYLLRNDFRRIDFEGLGPLNHREWCTSVFYRDNNCFNI